MHRPPLEKHLEVPKGLHPQQRGLLLDGVAQIGQLPLDLRHRHRFHEVSAGVEVKGLPHVLGELCDKNQIAPGAPGLQLPGQGNAAHLRQGHFQKGRIKAGPGGL